MIVNKYGGGSGSGSGERGPQGYQGPQGNEGAVGPQGYQGPAGEGSGSGDNHLLKSFSSMPSGASVGDVYAIHSESSSTQTWTSGITTGFTQFRVPLNATSECSLQGFHMGGDTYYTDLWWHGEDDPKRWDMRGTATNFEVISLNTEFTYTANTNTITAAIDGDYVVVTLSQPVTEYNVVDGIQIMNEVIIPEKNDVYQVAEKSVYDVTTTLIDSRIDGSTTLAKGVKIEINTPPSADTIVTNIEYFGSYFYFHVLTDGSVQIKDGKYDEVVVTAAEGDSGQDVYIGPLSNYNYTDGVFTLSPTNGDEVAYENTIEHIGDMRTITYGERLAKESDIPVIDDSRLLPENPNESAMPIYNNQNGWVTTNRDAVFTDGMYAFQNNWLDDGQHYVMTRDGYFDINWTPSYRMVKLTQTEYDNMSSHDSNTLYIIIPDTNVGA